MVENGDMKGTQRLIKKATSVHLKTEAAEIPWAYHTEPIDTIMSLP